jgi:hypothetical protein
MVVIVGFVYHTLTYIIEPVRDLSRGCRGATFTSVAARIQGQQRSDINCYQSKHSNDPP